MSKPPKAPAVLVCADDSRIDVLVPLTEHGMSPVVALGKKCFRIRRGERGPKGEIVYREEKDHAYRE